MTHPELRDVYCDLRRKCASVKPPGGRVEAKPGCVVVHDVTFRVSEAGRQRAIRDGVRNVHAFARGAIASLDSPHAVGQVAADPRAVRLHYNPFRAGTFTDASGAPVHTARTLAISGKTAWVIR